MSMALRKVGAIAHKGWPLAAMLLFCAIIIGPWVPSSFDVRNADALTIDLSAYVAFFDALLNQRQFGVDVVHPYGPYFFVTYPYYYPGTFAGVIAGRLLVAFTLGVVAWRLLTFGEGFSSRRPATFILIPLLLAFLLWFAKYQSPAQTWLIVGTTLSYFFADKGKAGVATLIGVFGCALLGLSKFNNLILFLVQIAAFTANDLIHRRRPYALGVAIIALLAFWMLAGQNPANLPLWFLACLDQTGGFSDAGVLWGIATPEYFQILALMTSAGVVALVHLLLVQRVALDKGGKVLSFLAVGPAFYAAYKYGVVRHDGHAADAAIQFIAIATLYLIILRQTATTTDQTARIGRLSAATLSLTVAANLLIALQWKAPTPTPEFILTIFQRDLNAMLKMPFGGLANIQEGFRKAQRRLAIDSGLVDENGKPNVHGPLDVYLNNPGIVPISGLTYQPRPVALGQTAYTSYSNKLNAAYLERGGAPNLIMDFDLDDNKLPASEESLSWPVLLSHYQPGAQTARNLQLERKAAKAVTIRPLKDQVATLDRPMLIENAQGSALWARLELRPSLLGRLYGFLLRPPIFEITLRRADSHTESRRIVPAMVRDGFLLSPTILTETEFRRMYGGARDSIWLDAALKDFTISMKPALPFLVDKSIRVHLSEIEIAGLNDRAIIAPMARLEAERLGRLNVLARASNPPRSAPNLQLEYDSVSAKQVLTAHAPTSLLLPVTPTDRALSMTFGMFSTAYDAPPPERGDGVDFIVWGVSASGARTQLGVRTVDPSRSKDDRGDQHMSIAFAPRRFTALVLETNVRTAGNYDKSYWSDYALR